MLSLLLIYKEFIVKKTLLLLTGLLLLAQAAVAQVKPVNIVKNANRFTYEVYDYGEKIDTSQLKISLEESQLYYLIFQDEKPGRNVPGYAYETTYVDLKNDSTCLSASFRDPYWETVEVASPFSRSDIAYETTVVDGLTRYTCHINSNTLELFVQDFPVDINPLTY